MSTYIIIIHRIKFNSSDNVQQNITDINDSGSQSSIVVRDSLTARGKCRVKYYDNIISKTIVIFHPVRRKLFHFSM